jgi:hypothetical protein
LSDKYGDTGAAILQGTDELSSATTEKLLSPVAILVQSVASSVQPLLCVFKKSIFYRQAELL